jgi:hypothetical protein
MLSLSFFSAADIRRCLPPPDAAAYCQLRRLFHFAAIDIFAIDFHIAAFAFSFHYFRYAS